ncbi:MAG: IS1 family transposase [Candidatus Pacearchaeota archaeon]
MSEVIQKLRCPHCHSTKVVKNGKKSNGQQNYKCQSCGKQFQFEYFYKACHPEIQVLMKRMLLRGSGVRDICKVLLVSINAVLRLILRWGKAVEIKPSKKYYRKVQMDELWSFVGKKEKKVWILYAYCSESKEILAVTMGKRNKHRVKDLLKRLKGIEIDFYATDSWKKFADLLPYFKHLIGKKHTKGIEGRNSWIRRRLSRLFRRSTTFSKKLTYHWNHFKLLVWANQSNLSYI